MNADSQSCKVLVVILLTAMAAACTLPEPGSEKTPIALMPATPPTTHARDIDAFLPFDLRLEAAAVQGDQAALEVFMQIPESLAPDGMLLPTYITLTLPAQVTLVEGDATWETRLASQDIFSRQVKIEVGELDAPAVLRLSALVGDRSDAFKAVGRSIVLCMRRRADGSLEFSQDCTFGEGYRTPVGGPGLTPTPDDFEILDDSSGIETLPPVP